MQKTQTSSKPLRLDHKAIDPAALAIVDSLQSRGFTAYLVGGCVRDLLLGKRPKDFDIATTALPQQIRRAVPNAFIIGKRFRLVLVKRGNVQYEVATFRRDARPNENLEELPPGDNIFGTPQEDAKRRDFTINALFYDPQSEDLIDYAGGLKDLDAGIVRMIGDPNVRLIEDPIRILRGIRLAHMIRFRLESGLKSSMGKTAPELKKTALPRRREEILKFLRLDDPSLAFLTAYDLGVLASVSPTLDKFLSHGTYAETFVQHLSSFHDHELSTPVELFGGMMLAFLLTETGGELVGHSGDEFRARDILEHKTLHPMMQTELGMFKNEQTVFAKAVQLMALLKKRREFERRGERRQKAVVFSEAFPLALKLAEHIHWLSPSDLHFWREIGAKSGRSRPKRPRRRRRRHPPTAPGPAAPAPEGAEHKSSKSTA